MTQRNQTGQGVGAEEVFVKRNEKAGLPGFGFCGQGEIGTWLSQRRLPKKKPANNCISEAELGCWV
jgi:hypothetical protein